VSRGPVRSEGARPSHQWTCASAAAGAACAHRGWDADCRRGICRYGRRPDALGRSLPLARRLETNRVNCLAARRHRPDDRNALTLGNRGGDTTQRGHVHDDLSAVAAEHEVVAVNCGNDAFDTLTILGGPDRTRCDEKERSDCHAPSHAPVGAARRMPWKREASRAHASSPSPLPSKGRRKGGTHEPLARAGRHRRCPGSRHRMLARFAVRLVGSAINRRTGGL